MPWNNTPEQTDSQRPRLVPTDSNARHLASSQTPTSKTSPLKSLLSQLVRPFKAVWEWIKRLLDRSTSSAGDTSNTSATRIPSAANVSTPSALLHGEPSPATRPVEASPQSTTPTLPPADIRVLPTVCSATAPAEQARPHEHSIEAPPSPPMPTALSPHEVTPKALTAPEIAPSTIAEPLLNQEAQAEAEDPTLEPMSSSLNAGAALHKDIAADFLPEPAISLEHVTHLAPGMEVPAEPKEQMLEDAPRFQSSLNETNSGLLNEPDSDPLPAMRSARHSQAQVTIQASRNKDALFSTVSPLPLPDKFTKHPLAEPDIALSPMATPSQTPKLQAATSGTMDSIDSEITVPLEFAALPPGEYATFSMAKELKPATLTATQTTAQVSSAVMFNQPTRTYRLRPAAPNSQRTSKQILQALSEKYADVLRTLSSNTSEKPPLKLESDGAHLTNAVSSSPPKKPTRIQAVSGGATLSSGNAEQARQERVASLIAEINTIQKKRAPKDSSFKPASNSAPQQIHSVEQPPTRSTAMESPPSPKAATPSIAPKSAVPAPNGNPIAPDTLPVPQAPAPVIAPTPAVPAKPRGKATIVVPNRPVRSPSRTTQDVAYGTGPTLAQPSEQPIAATVLPGKTLTPAFDDLAAMKADVTIVLGLADFKKPSWEQMESVLKQGQLLSVHQSLARLHRKRTGDGQLQIKISKLLQQTLAKQSLASWADANAKTLETITTKTLQALARDFAEWASQALSLGEELNEVIDTHMRIQVERKEAAIAKRAASRATDAGASAP